jgi:hypothetical protein
VFKYVLALLVVLTACQTPPSRATVQFEVQWNQTALKAQFLPIAAQSIRIEAAQASTPNTTIAQLTLTKSNTPTSSGSMDIPLGSVFFRATVFSGSNATGASLVSTTKTQSIIAGIENTVTLEFPTPTIQVTPVQPVALAGGSAVQLSANLSNSSGTLEWSLAADALGSLSATTGSSVLYTPPTTIAALGVVPVTVKLAGEAITTTVNVQLTTAACNASEPNNSLAQAAPIAFATAVSGGICVANDLDFYTFTLNTPQLVTVTIISPFDTTGTPFNPNLSMYSKKNTDWDYVFASYDRGYQQYNPYQKIWLPAGTYVIGVGNENSSGGIDYTYTVEVTTQTAPTAVTLDARAGVIRQKNLTAAETSAYAVFTLARGNNNLPLDYAVLGKVTLPNSQINNVVVYPNGRGYSQNWFSSATASGTVSVTFPNGTAINRTVNTANTLALAQNPQILVSPDRKFITIKFDPIVTANEYSVEVTTANNWLAEEVISTTSITLPLRTATTIGENLNVYIQAFNAPYSTIPTPLPDKQFDTSRLRIAYTVPALLAPSLSSLNPNAGVSSGGNTISIIGTNLLGTTSVKFGSAEASSFKVISNTEIRAVPNAATGIQNVSVQTPAGISNTVSYSFTPDATGVDFAVLGMLVTQATQNLGNTVPILTGRAARAEVFIKAINYSSLPILRLRATVNNTDLGYVDWSAPSVTTGTTAVTYAGLIPNSWLQKGLQISAEIDPLNTQAESLENNNRYPSTSGLAFTVETVPDLEITWLPIIHNGIVPATTPTALFEYIEPTKRMMPVVKVNARVRIPMVFNGDLSIQSENSRLLAEFSAIQIADGSDRYYHGLLPPYKPNLWGGVAFGYRRAISQAYTPYNTVVAHELGHNWGLPHAPCGNPAGIDPYYPYTTGSIGVSGYDLTTNTALDPATQKDVMTYCSPKWISDYNYIKVLQRRLTEPKIQDAVSLASPQLLITGTITPNGKTTFEPIIRLSTKAQNPNAGTYQLELLNNQNQVIKSVSFQPTETEDNQGTQLFAFTVPFIEGITSAQIRTPNQSIAAQQSPKLQTQNLIPTRTIRQANGMIEIRFDPQIKKILIRDGKDGTVMGFGQQGQATVQPTQPELEILYLDGINTRSEIIRY